MTAFEEGQRVHLPGRRSGWVTIDLAQATADGGWKLAVLDEDGVLHRVVLRAEEVKHVAVATQDGRAPSERVLAGLWTQWMRAAATNASATLLASSPLRPYAHQSNAVYGAMLPQPRLRFLLGDEPGTGKTIMAGLYLREMQKIGLVHRALVVVPAGLVTKWQADFARFFGGELRRITNETIQQHGLAAPHDMWVVSLELAAINPAVQEAIRPDRAGWDVVVFDEAHRLTPTAETFYQVATLLAKNTPRALLMTATPHRGNEWLFRHLLHLVDPDVYPDPGNDPKTELRPVKPGSVHFLRRMKENLVDYDGKTPLFKGRHASNKLVRLNLTENSFYREALNLVDEYFPAGSASLARMVYGKRAASSLYALAETLKRRRDGMGSTSAAQAVQAVDPYDEDPVAQDEARIVVEGSRAAKQEKRAISDLLGRLEPLLLADALPVSKWFPLVDECLVENAIKPGNGQQAVIFTEYADTADWLVNRLTRSGYTARRYSGRDNHQVRDEIRSAFMVGDFQIIVSTDAGNEGIDLQTAHVLVNYDVPWSLVRLEQRMGRIHRVGQGREVELYNLVAQGTREGDVLAALLANFITAANQLNGQMFDSLSLVAEMAGMKDDRLAGLFADTYADDEDKRADALAAVQAITAGRLHSTAQHARKIETELASTVDVNAAIERLHADILERINPAIVEAFIDQLQAARLLSSARTASGEGILRITTPDGVPLPETLGSQPSAVVATSGKALSDAQANGAILSHVIPLGPGEPAFRDLVGYARTALSTDVFRGGLVADQTAINDYDLFALEGTLVEVDGQRISPWTVLIRVDAAGARPVRWEVLANLTPASGVGSPPHPARILDAQARAEQMALEEQAKRQAAMRSWLARAERELRDLPNKISQDIGDREQRVATRNHVGAMVAARLRALRQLGEIRIDGLHTVGHVRVRAAGISPDPTEADSEQIAMRRVHDLLTEDGFSVADVHTEGRGYDLYATRGHAQRCIEVKGVWGSAAAEGVRLTGNEILIATQQHSDYWLYVIDGCSDQRGSVFGTYRDPVTTFQGLIKQDAVFRLPGSALKAARQEVRSA